MLFSIVIPTHNRAIYLEQILSYFAPLLSNSSSSHEVIVIDGFSTDATPTIVRKYLANYPNLSLKYLAAPSNSPAVKRNLGIKASGGNWIIFLDDDCIPHSGFLESYYHSISKSKHDPQTVHLGEIVYPSQLVAASNYFRYRQSRHITTKSRSSQPISYNNIVTMNMCLNAAFIKANSIYFDTSFDFYGEDIDYGLRLYHACATFRISSASVTHRESTPDVISWYTKLTDPSKVTSTYSLILNFVRYHSEYSLPASMLLLVLTTPVLLAIARPLCSLICNLLVFYLKKTDSLHHVYLPKLYLLVERLVIVINCPLFPPYNRPSTESR